MTEPMTDEQANAVYDVLVKLAGATEYGREGFTYLQIHNRIGEYRFAGSLGFGGKFWNCGERWYVTCYREDETPARLAAVDATNEALAVLKNGVTA